MMPRAPDDPDALTNPAALVEVLSEHTERDDRGEKFRHYRHLASLEEYVLVSQHTPRVEVFRREAGVWTYREHGPGDTLALRSLGVELLVDALYVDPGAAG